MNEDKKIPSFKIPPEKSERFEKVKLEDTQVVGDQNNSFSNYDKLTLEELLLQLKTTMDRKVRSQLKKKIKQLSKKVAK